MEETEDTKDESPLDFSEITHHKKKVFLGVFARKGNVTKAAEAAKISRRTHTRWLNNDAVYAVCFEDAKDAAADNLEDKAYERAMDGSDLMTIFLLKAFRPDKFKDRGEQQHNISTVVTPTGAPDWFTKQSKVVSDREIAPSSNGNGNGNGHPHS